MLSIVVPVYNEEESLKILYEEIKSVLSSHSFDAELLFIDDGSNDGSLDVLKEIAKEDERVKVISFRRNFGQTAAISAGIDYAKGDVIVTIDADLQNDPKDIPLLLKKIDEGYDVVSGWRRKRKDSFILRHIPSILANKLISALTGVPLHDYGCTLKAYRRDVIKNIRLYGQMHRFIPALLSWQGVKILEVEVNHRARKYGRAKYGLERTLKVILDLLVVKFLLSYVTAPIQIFGKIAFYSAFFGFFFGVATVYMKIVHKVDMTGNPFLLLSVMLILMGVQFLMMGILGEILTRTYHESQARPIYSIKEKVNV